MEKVLGIDSSTQSTKAVLCEADSGRILAEGKAEHPPGSECPPEMWWRALHEATQGLVHDVSAISIAAQQHGMVVLDDAGAVVRPAILWNDNRSAQAGRALIDEFGGPGAWARAVGSVPVASFTVTKLRWLAECEPQAAARTASVLLPHDWLTWRLLGRRGDFTTDRGDASGTGYWDPASGRYQDVIIIRAFGRLLRVPRVLQPAEPAGETPEGCVVGAGTGDNMAAALGLDPQPGDVIVSLGTSGTVFATRERPTADIGGTVAGFADATGRFLPLVATLNAARILTSTAAMLRTDLAGLDRLALAGAPGAEGIVFLPYLDGERTPNLPDATGSLHHLTRASLTPENIARAAVEGMLCGLSDGITALRSEGVEMRRVILIGGGARSSVVQAIAPEIFGLPVAVPSPREYVALGAARQAAWVLQGGHNPPKWSIGIHDAQQFPTGGDTGLTERFVQTRRSVYGK